MEGDRSPDSRNIRYHFGYTGADTTELTAKKRELTALLDEVKQKLSIRDTIEKNAAKKAEILAREKE